MTGLESETVDSIETPDPISSLMIVMPLAATMKVVGGVFWLLAG